MAAVQQFDPGLLPTSIKFMSLHADMELDADHVASTDAHSSQPREPCAGLQVGDARAVVVIFNPGQESIVSAFAEVLGRQLRTIDRFDQVTSADRETVFGIPVANARETIISRDRSVTVAINAHCVSLGMPPDVFISNNCDFEFLHTESLLCRRDLARFIAHTLGQVNHHESLMAKPRTYFISTTFPDVRAALANIDILTVGADAVELRVDLLEDPGVKHKASSVPSLNYVGEQVMLLRQRTELPIIFTTRCTKENGKFPMDDPDLYFEYLHRAVQWGVEYIDVELWLPEMTRKRLYAQRGNSRIMSAFHDFTPENFRWTSGDAEAIFRESMRYSDIVKMNTLPSEYNENFELEYFRTRARSEYPEARFSAVTMGEVGQISRTLNQVFTPITHPLLPIIAAPGQMSAAEINQALALLGRLPKKSIYGIGISTRAANSQAPFFQKCFNELGLPHEFSFVERYPGGSGTFPIETWCDQKQFGGAYLSPPLSVDSLVKESPFFASVNNGTGPILSEAVQIIGTVDTIVVHADSGATSASSSASPSIPSSPGHSRHSSDTIVAVTRPKRDVGLSPSTTVMLENASWNAILKTLTRDFAPSAYNRRAAVVLASLDSAAASAIYALRVLRVGKIYTVGFRTPPSLAGDIPIEPFNSLESLQKARTTATTTSGGSTPLDDADEKSGDSAVGAPFVIINALGPEKNNLVGMLLRLFGTPERDGGERVFVDLSSPGRGPSKGTSLAGVAALNGFHAYSATDAAAFTTAETLRLLVGQNVPPSFVRSLF